MSEYFPEELDEDFVEQMELMVSFSCRQVMAGSTSEQFLNWAKSFLPVIAPNIFSEFKEADRNRVAFWVGVNLWNAAPQPDNHFLPRPLPEPVRSGLCPCSSGRNYNLCCARLPEVEPMPSDLFWVHMPDVVKKVDLAKGAKNLEYPVEGVAIMAAELCEQEEFGHAIKLLNPYFVDDAPLLDSKHSGLLDMLCDCYDNYYRSDRAKKDLLARATQHRDNVIRAEAWQRMATWQQDLGNLDASSKALGESMRADPNNPSHALLEIILLISNNKEENAKQRAQFWYHKLKPRQQEFPELLGTLKHAQQDPRTAVSGLMNEIVGNDDARLYRLTNWIERLRAREVPQYEVEDLNAAGDIPPAEPIKAVMLIPPEKVIKIGMAWERVKPVEKPFSTVVYVEEAEDVWLEADDDEWLRFIEDHPESMDSLDILDDLVSLIYMHPNNESVFGPIGLIKPICERALEIIENAEIGRERILPWLLEHNRPALRIFFHLISLLDAHGQSERAAQLMRQYLLLNPHDNHGFRDILINKLLVGGNDQEALDLADEYVFDGTPEIVYGRVLALFRMGRKKEASDALLCAYNSLPLVAEFLVKKSAPKPKPGQFGIEMGGREEAWIYRDSLRDVWLATPGCMDWLAQQLTVPQRAATVAKKPPAKNKRNTRKKK